ncbi:MAG: hypothetical protein JWM16_2841, partial [Verrucomicrobiales bacterium]|nr:hypothetical protein [Verrucomicrobiales bacterium]
IGKILSLCLSTGEEQFSNPLCYHLSHMRCPPMDVPIGHIAVVNFELRVLHPVQQHVHAGEVAGDDILLLPGNLTDATARVVHLLAHVEQQ